MSDMAHDMQTPIDVPSRATGHHTTRNIPSRAAPPPHIRRLLHSPVTNNDYSHNTKKKKNLISTRITYGQRRRPGQIQYFSHTESPPPPPIIHTYRKNHGVGLFNPRKGGKIKRGVETVKEEEGAQQTPS